MELEALHYKALSSRYQWTILTRRVQLLFLLLSWTSLHKGERDPSAAAKAIPWLPAVGEGGAHYHERGLVYSRLG